MKQRKLSRGLLISGLLIAALLPTVILYARNLFIAHDLSFHNMRILCIAAEMRIGNPFPAVYSYAVDGFGYASPIFYHDLFFYPFALLNLLGVDVVVLDVLLIVVQLLLSFGMMYFCSRAIFRDDEQAFVAALAYAFSYYTFCDIFARGAVSEAFGLCFFPVVYLGYFYLRNGQRERWWVLALGMAAVFYAHTLSVILAAVFLIVLILIDLPHWLKHLSDVEKFVQAALLFLALTAAYWAPMLEQMLQIDLRIAHEHPDHRYELNYTLKTVLTPLIQFLLGDSPFTPRLTGAFGYLALGLCAFTMVKARRHRRLLAALLFMLWMTTKYSPSLLLERFLSVIQFPFRFLAPATLLLALCLGAGYGLLRRRGAKRCVIALLVLSSLSASVLCLPLNNLEIARAYADWPTSELYTMDEICGEHYLPNSVPYERNYAYRADRILMTPAASDESVAFSLSRTEKNELVVDFSGNPGGATIDLPLVYYVGYTAENASGAEYALSPDNGCVRLALGEAASDAVTLRYRGTPVQSASAAISLLTAVTFAGIALYRKKSRIKAKI